MSKSDWIASFLVLFPEFSPILNDSGEDVTDATIEEYLDITMDMLPQPLINYLSRASMQNMLFYATAHMLTYFNVKDGYSQSRTLTKNLTQMSAQGLSTPFESVAKMRGEMFATLSAFLNTTAYGVMAAVYLEKTSGNIGGFTV